MSAKNAVFKYDAEGRLIEVKYLNGATLTYSYDAMGNRTAVVEVPGLDPVLLAPTVAAFPKKQIGDISNNAMIVKLSTGELVGWGDNTTGVLANGIAAATNQPAQSVLFDPNTPNPPFDATIVDWAFTNANLYVVFSNGWVYSAGKNAFGQLGHGNTVALPYLKRIEYFVTNSLSITKVWAAGSAGTTDDGGCVYFQASDYSMYACGHNVAGNLGNAATPTTNVTTPAPCNGIGYTTNHVIEVAIGCAAATFSAFMLFNDGTMKVAGYNGQGQLGVNATTNVTGGFISAKKVGLADVSNFVSISVNGGYTSAYAGNAIAIDTDGNVWTTGYNAYGVLGLNDTTNRLVFTQVTALSNIIKAELGGGQYGYGYAIKADGALYTWGYNYRNNLFQDSTTNILVPTLAQVTPGAVTKVFFPKGNALSSYSQLIAVTASGRLIYAGWDNGQLPIDSAVSPGAYSFLATPRKLLDGTETIVDMFVHGSVQVQRLFVLTDAGNLYACGNNTDSICTGGVSSNTLATNVEFFQIRFSA